MKLYLNFEQLKYMQLTAMEIVKILAQKIATLHQDKQHCLLAICGAADLGKSYLAQAIVQELQFKNLLANHLYLDAFLMDRKERQLKGISGYQIEAYDLAKLGDNIHRFQNQQSLQYQAYNHLTGRKSKAIKQIEARSVLILDGLHAMHQSIFPMLDYSIFIYTDDKYLKELRSEADLVKRNYTPEYSKQIREQEFNLFKSEVEPYKSQANCQVYLAQKWTYKLKFYT